MKMMRKYVAFLVYEILMAVVKGQNYYYNEQRQVSPAMWNIMARKPLSLNPSGSVCDDQSESRVFCVPNVYGGAQTPGNNCLPRSCLAQNNNLSVIPDDNLATVFITRNLNTSLELTADLTGSYTIYYIRIAFSGNPPTSIVIQRYGEGNATGRQEWTNWRIFAVDCLTTFGLNPVLRAQTSNQEDLACSPLPWSSQRLTVVSSLVWNVILDYPNSTLDERPGQGVTALRFIIAGHLLPFPQAGTSSSSDVYGIADIGVYGRCAVGSYRSLDSSTCNTCRCNIPGSFNQTCNAQGNCLCKSNFRGSKCSSCSSGFFNASAGCLPCRCDELGSQEGLCNSESGSCVCRTGFIGPICSDCAAGLFLLGHLCAPCDCNPAGSLPGCDIRTGACTCKRFVTGVRCDVCLDGFVDLQQTRPEGCIQRTTSSPMTTTSTAMSLMNEAGVGVNLTSANQSTLLMEAREITASFSIENGSLIQEVPSTTFPTTLFLSSNFGQVPVGSSLVNSTTSIISTSSESQIYLGSPAVYGWLVAITVLLIITLLILLIHCLLHLRRGNKKGRYSPRQIPEFLATETTRKHPDYAAARPNPTRNSAKLTGYFYNPDYPLGSLTPGLNGRRDTRTVREAHNSRQGMEFAVNDDEEPFDRGQFPETRRALDLSQEPAPSGALPSRLSHYHTPALNTSRPIQTISGGIVNENFVE